MNSSRSPRKLRSTPPPSFLAVFLFLAIAGCDAFTASYSYHNVEGSSCLDFLVIETRGKRGALRKNNDAANSLHPSRASSTALSMGLFDFLNSRQGDFIPLRSSDDDAPYGPGPLILMYAVPKSMDDDELRDMAADGMPDVKGVVIRRIEGVALDGDEGRNTKGDELLDLTVQEALDAAFNEGSKLVTPIKEYNTAVVSTQQQHSENDPCPVLYFSGVTNSQMMSTYRLMANEIYEETNGIHWPACAKVVKPAMQKSLRQVLMEISGDHADAMKIRKGESEKSDES